MKLLPVFVVLFLGLPAGAKEIYTAIEDSFPKGRTILYVNRLGSLRMQTITTYRYLMQDGSMQTLPYKIPHLRDDRPITKKHPYICMLGVALSGSIGSAAPQVVRDLP